MMRTIRSLVEFVAGMLATLLVASIAVFLLLALMPGDPAALVANRGTTHATPESIEAIRKQLGLDRPLAIQYLDWLGGVVRGDLSESWLTGASVRELLAQRIGASLLLGGSVLAISLIATLVLGGIAGLRPGGVVDSSTRVLATVGTALPSFLLALIAIRVMAVGLGIGTVIGDGTVKTLPLPASVGAIGLTAFWVRPFRSLVVDALASDWALASKARGASNRRLLAAHALPNALVGFLPFLGLGLAGIFAGSLFIENVFSWPGLGPFVVESIKRRDLPVIQGFALITISAYVVTTQITDWVSRRLDPHRRPAAETER